MGLLDFLGRVFGLPERPEVPKPPEVGMATQPIIVGEKVGEPRLYARLSRLYQALEAAKDEERRESLKQSIDAYRFRLAAQGWPLVNNLQELEAAHARRNT